METVLPITSRRKVIGTGSWAARRSEPVSRPGISRSEAVVQAGLDEVLVDSDEGTAGHWEAVIKLNTWEHFYSGDNTSGGGVTRLVHGVIRLEKDSKVECAALQSDDKPLDTRYTYTTFSGHRIAR